MKTLKITIAALCIGSVAGTFALADIDDARNFYEFDEDLLTAGQPDATQLAEAGDDGIEVVINIVPNHEPVYNVDEEAILIEQGIEYIHVPVSWANPNAAEFDAFIAAMDRVGDRKVLVHCWANLRASALVTAYHVTQAPETHDAAMAQLAEIWRDAAGSDLTRNQTWQTYLAENLNRTR